MHIDSNDTRTVTRKHMVVKSRIVSGRCFNTSLCVVSCNTSLIFTDPSSIEVPLICLTMIYGKDANE